MVLPQLRALVATVPDTSEVAGSLAYLESRQAQMDYPRFVAEGWPIGSGMVESANKLVVEDRLKAQGCTGPRPTSIRFWRYGMRCAMTAGRSAGG
ncbi:hypothetical protein [Kouleothrix sp.]|uniref:hypothetical protein n=1 Tax=Kouleothrix sp. TaxID=2779161 RepID=UPI00391DBABD